MPSLPDTAPHHRRPALTVATTALAAAVLVLLAACSRKAPPEPPPRPVVAVAAKAAEQTPIASLPAQIEARYSTPLSFRVAGKIIERSVRLGDAVKAGQIVARLDPADLSKNAASARAQLDAAQHQLDYATQTVTRDRAQARENLIAPAQLEQSENAYASALAQRNQASQQAALAADQLSYGNLKAERDGVITAEQADTGQNVSAGQPVYQLAWTGDVDVVADVPEAALGALRIGQTATVSLPAVPGKTWQARVREVAPAADPLSRTYRAKLSLLSPGPDVKLGMTANVAFAQPLNLLPMHAVSPAASAPAASASAPSAASSGSASSAPATSTPPAAAVSDGPPITLPSTALFHDGNQPAVWIVKADDTLVLRRVRIARYGERTVTVAGGVQPGERVVWQGVHTVTAGEKVRVVAPLHPEDFAS
ncbi:efflux RND transporter periplasmic adaptor subunit [Pandoraea nosoerga]|nr:MULTISPECIES: efflux RND transporter periplasmic adaptor subunit [Pandoraea]MBN4665304.1 efflux RND transporter periplasmic adaptor subunit [Pandoraea nosoerga]MBN4674704.1 efflux RND transporter periplasmic adaptor subunit [Pandoraea nosoerga]MBN4680593.1 efflux RND transporter periplasmic adaptor subunit [Pandoraea nosoerga]MBN4743998.1 efflux RND transporter periplasmic adaptor subunit [Pandoraea nosoerga]